MAVVTAEPEPAGTGAEPRRTERFALDGYRAVAAIAVLVFHSYQFNRVGPASHWPLEGTVWHEAMLHTDLAVDMFFVLSGLLLGLPFARSALGLGPARSARLFLKRRLARIIPLYLTVVLLVWSITNHELPGDWRDLLLHLTLTQVYSSDKIFFTNGPAWTLACEVHFFIVLAVLGPLAHRRAQGLGMRGRYTLLLGGIATLMALSIGYRIWAAHVADLPATAWSVWFNPLAKLDVFAIGLLLAVVAANRPKITSAVARWALVGGAVGVVGLTVLFRPEHGGTSVFQHTLAGLACALLLASSTLAPVQPRWLGSRAVVFLGTVSYGLYLWQEPVQRLLAHLGLLLPKQGGPVFLVDSAIVFTATIVVAWVSYHVIERTGLRFGASLGPDGRGRDYYPDTRARPDPPVTPAVAPR